MVGQSQERTKEKLAMYVNKLLNGETVELVMDDKELHMLQETAKLIYDRLGYQKPDAAMAMRIKTERL